MNVHVSFLYPFKIVKQHNMFSGRLEKIKVPDGEYHIFEVKVTFLPRLEGQHRSQVLKEAAPRSFCGKARSDIGNNVSESEKAPHSNVCKECEAKYKSDPRSAWFQFVNGNKSIAS